jgi:thymidylate synthase ThyX
LNYNAEIVLDSIAPNGSRLTTFELTLPKFVLAEVNTHRSGSRSAASSRAIPTSKVIEQVMNNPVIPAYIGKNKAGMQATEELIGQERQEFLDIWLSARDFAVDHVQKLVKLGVHKQLSSRILEPWMWVKVIFSATHYQNFFNLRANKMAQPEFRVVAEKMLELYLTNKPKELVYGEWHLPYISDLDVDLDLQTKQKISCARAARVSYLNHDKVRDIEKDLELYERLVAERHLSPLEHAATPCDGVYGNFTGWKQYRKLICPDFEG